MTKRTAWAVLTGSLMIAWAVVVALVIPVLTPWASDTEILVVAAIAGLGAGMILWLRMKRLPEPPMH